MPLRQPESVKKQLSDIYMLACVEVTDAFANEKIIPCPIVGYFVLLVTVTYLTLEDESLKSHTFFFMQ